MNSIDPRDFRRPRPYEEDFYGWAWRGAHLCPRELAVYSPGVFLKHLGEARASSRELRDFPVIFWIYAWEGFKVPEVMDDVAFWQNTCFKVVRVDAWPGNRTSIFLDQVSSGCGQEPERERAYLDRCALFNPPPPPPTAELIHAWQAPFARWDEHAGPGEAPLLGAKRR